MRKDNDMTMEQHELLWKLSRKVSFEISFRICLESVFTDRDSSLLFYDLMRKICCSSTWNDDDIFPENEKLAFSMWINLSLSPLWFCVEIHTQIFHKCQDDLFQHVITIHGNVLLLEQFGSQGMNV